MLKVNTNSLQKWIRLKDVCLKMSGTAIPYAFVEAPLKNGIGRHICQLKRLTIKFCKSHGSSRHTRFV